MLSCDRQSLVAAVLSLLTERGLLTDAALERARRAAEASFERVDIVLGKLGLVAEEHLAYAWSEVTGLRIADPADLHLLPAARLAGDASDQDERRDAAAAQLRP